MHIVKYPNPHTKGLSLGWSGLGNLTRMNIAQCTSLMLHQKVLSIDYI